MLLKICLVSLHLVHISVWLFPRGRITSSLYIHCDQRHTSLHTTAIVPIDNKSLLRNCNPQAQPGIVLVCLIFLNFQMIEFLTVMGDSFISAIVERNTDWTAMSTSIISTNRLYRREIVFLMVVSCILFRFVFKLYVNCRSTFVASQNLGIPWFVVALHCKNGDRSLSSMFSLESSNWEHE